MNVFVTWMPLFDLKLTFAENGVDYTRDLLGFIFVFLGATNVINVDMGSEFFGVSGYCS